MRVGLEGKKAGVRFSHFVILLFVCGCVACGAAARAQNWQAVPMVTQASRNAGYKGGEGAQVIRALAVSAADPNFLMMGTDVGGIYRSLDGGNNWQVCMVGWNARGGNHFALDPRNANRLLGMAGNGSDWNAGWGASPNGVYLSTDKGASWKQVLPRNEGNDARASLAYDPSSYDAALGYCKTAYYDSRDAGLYKSVDGGQTWKQASSAYSDMAIRVHPTKGYVYLASNNSANPGLYRSTDGGKTFTRLNTVHTYNIDVIASRPDSVYAARADGVQISTDAGLTFKAFADSGLPANTAIIDVAVSPANPNHMTCWHGGAQWWEAYHYYSSDGGATWQKQAWNNTYAFFPNNVRGGVRAWHPTQANVVFGEGGDWITRSTDGGATFAWAANGYNAVMVGSSFGFSPATPTAVYLSFQDYNGAATTDDGSTWTYCNPAGNGWGGFEYGGFALDAKHMWSGDAPSWGGTRTLKVSIDGGVTWTIKQSGGANITFSGPDVSGADPANLGVGFASNWRTADSGITWTALSGCDAVFTYNPTGAKELYGKHGSDIVKSLDHGLTWTKVATIDGGITDLAYDQVKKRFWIASGDSLKKYENGALTAVAIPSDQRGGARVGSVAVDPGNPNVVYAACHRDIYACNNAVVRSTDGGVTWKNLTVTAPLANSTAAGGPHEVQWLRVNPKTHYLWAAGQCFGVWKMAPPPAPTFAATAR